MSLFRLCWFCFNFFVCLLACELDVKMCKLQTDKFPKSICDSKSWINLKYTTKFRRRIGIFNRSTLFIIASGGNKAHNSALGIDWIASNIANLAPGQITFQHRSTSDRHYVKHPAYLFFDWHNFTSFSKICIWHHIIKELDKYTKCQNFWMWFRKNFSWQTDFWWTILRNRSHQSNWFP